MVSNAVKERLLQKDWYVECKTKKDADLVLQTCDEAGIIWRDGDKATEWKQFKQYPLCIIFYQNKCGVMYDYSVDFSYYKENEMENITDWFFNAIKNNDSKLTPQNAEQEHLVQMLLAKLQGIPVEFWNDFDQIWGDSSSDSISISVKYRLKPELILTPLPISRELWSYIDKQWKFAAMDKNKKIFFYEEKPYTYMSNCWVSSSDGYSKCPLNINTDGINWKLSLTERPEDI